MDRGPLPDFSCSESNHAHTALDLRPGCFSGALTFQSDDGVCRGCEFAAACAPIAAESRARLEAEFAPQRAAEDKERKAGQNERQERSRAGRAFNPPSPSEALTPELLSERERRERVLTAFLAAPSLDHHHRKLKGRAAEISFVWLARELAKALNKPGKKASAQAVHDALGFIPGAHTPKDRFQVSRDLEWVTQFEAELWRSPKPGAPG